VCEAPVWRVQVGCPTVANTRGKYSQVLRVYVHFQWQTCRANTCISFQCIRTFQGSIERFKLVEYSDQNMPEGVGAAHLQYGLRDYTDHGTAGYNIAFLISQPVSSCFG
jgi:hypothetical protein